MNHMQQLISAAVPSVMIVAIISICLGMVQIIGNPVPLSASEPLEIEESQPGVAKAATQSEPPREFWPEGGPRISWWAY